MGLLDNPVRQIVSGTQAIAAAGTAEPLVSSVEGTVAWVVITANPGNTGDIYIGDEDVDSTNGVTLAATSHPLLLPVDPSGIHVDAETNDEGVGFIYGIV